MALLLNAPRSRRSFLRDARFALTAFARRFQDAQYWRGQSPIAADSAKSTRAASYIRYRASATPAFDLIFCRRLTMPLESRRLRFVSSPAE